MHNLKLISFNMLDSLEDLGLPDAASLRIRVIANTDQDREALANDLRRYGLPMVRSRIIDALAKKRTTEILAALPGDTRLAEQLGIVFKEIAGGEFIYQGEKATIKSFKMAETPFTIGMMKRLLELRENEVRQIFTVSGYSVDEVIQKSLDKIAGDVAEEERNNCPLVHASYPEANAICQLIMGEDLPGEMQWERAAAGRDGKKRPWGEDFDPEKVVCYVEGGVNGTRPVKSKPAGASPEGIHDLMGNVSEWTKEAVFLGGSWTTNFPYYFQASYRDQAYPRGRHESIGFRLAMT
ncbi:MAG: SUMF1/EgtB/PvdO family nonheme iron enzyme [Candidatus Saganbacteria bacterium]|nr:SUMF1/EgtB/PvdO family nonheme iron enzyme [Candidatus Saganbacteria bacterium]